MRKLFVVAYLLGTVPMTEAQECSQLLSQGIYDIRSSASDLNTASSFSQWFCDKKLSSSDQANEFGASLGFPFKGVPVKLGFDSSSQSWSQWYSSFCGSVKSDQSLQSKVRDHVQTINPQIIQAFNACIQSDGLHVWLERTYDPRTFLFVGYFNPPDPELSPKTTITRFDQGPNVTCKPKPITISKNEWRTRCERKDDKPITIVVNATKGPIRGGGRLDLPEITRFELPIQSDYEITDRQPYTYKFSFVVFKEKDKDEEKVWISLKEPSGGYLDGKNPAYNLYLSKNRREAQIPIPKAGVYAYGKVSLKEYPDLQQTYVYFDGGLHTTDGTERTFTNKAVGRVDGILK